STCRAEITWPHTGMYGCFGSADTPAPWLMMWPSCAAVSELAPVSAGTSGETPPLPSRPWRWAPAKLATSGAPAGTFGAAACVGGDVETAVVAAVELFVARPRKTPPSSAAAAHASTTSTISAAALSGFWNRLDMPIEGGTGRADRPPYFSVTLGALAG